MTDTELGLPRQRGRPRLDTTVNPRKNVSLLLVSPELKARIVAEAKRTGRTQRQTVEVLIEKALFAQQLIDALGLRLTEHPDNKQGQLLALWMNKNRGES